MVFLQSNGSDTKVSAVRKITRRFGFRRRLARGHRLTLAGCLMVLLMCLSPGSYNTTKDASKAQAAGSREVGEMNEIWQRVTRTPAFLTSSIDGKFIITVDNDGTLRCFGENGRVVWKLVIPGVDRVAAASDGSAVAYSFLNPVDSTAYFISSEGKLLWKHKTAGAIWSGSASSKVGQFAVGTGEKYVYIYTISARSHRYRRWKIPGAPCTVGFTRDGESVVVGTWQNSGVGRFTLTGRQLAWRAGMSDRLHSIETYAEGDGLLVTARPNKDAPKCTIYLKDESLRDYWVREFNDYKVTADACTESDCVAVGFQRPITHGGKDVLENRIALYDRRGNERWEKGGMFGKWNLLQVCSNGQVLVYDGSSVYLIGRTGNVLLKKQLPGTIHAFARSPMRNRIALALSNGQISLFEVK